MTLRDEISDVINNNSAENGSNTPDFVLADYLTACLAAFDAATNARDTWHSKPCTICSSSEPIAL